MNKKKDTNKVDANKKGKKKQGAAPRNKAMSSPITKPTVQEAVKESEPKPEPKPEPKKEEYVGFNVVGKWHHYDRCICSFCGESIVGIENAARHVQNNHMKPVQMIEKTVESKIVDSSGNSYKKTVLEEKTEEIKETENG